VCPLVVFVSYAVSNGDLSQFLVQDGAPVNWVDDPDPITNANKLCQTEAEAANLPGTFIAWLSSSADQPANPGGIWAGAQSSGPWYNTCALPGEVASDWADLTDGRIGATISCHADGRVSQEGAGCSGNPSNCFRTFPATGTSGSGTSTGNHCSSWTTSSTGVNLTYGSSNTTTDDWTSRGTDDCGATSSLYCFQVP